MERIKGQGLYNVVRFNWHFYVLSGVLLLLIIVVAIQLGGVLGMLLWVGSGLLMSLVLLSLGATYWVYDASNLYGLDWLDGLPLPKQAVLVNINAGFDETSGLLHNRYPQAQLLVCDFYDPARHTEMSIKRARKAYPPYLGTLQIDTSQLPYENHSVNVVLTILSAHEIRDEAERVVFFREVKRILKPDGKVVVTEHMCDTVNFIAYNIGAFHFHSRQTWLKSFAEAGLVVVQEIKITPFISTFILNKHDSAS